MSSLRHSLPSNSNPIQVVEVRRPNRRFSNVGWIVASQCAIALATLANVRILTEILTTRAFGSMNLALGLIALGRSVFCMPLSQAGARWYLDAVSSGEVNHFWYEIRRKLFSNSGVLIFTSLGACIPLMALDKLNPFGYLFAISLLVIDNFRLLQLEVINISSNQKLFSMIRMADAWLRPVASIAFVRLFGASMASILAAYTVISCTMLIIARSVTSHIPQRDRTLEPVVDSTARLNFGAELSAFYRPLMPIAMLEWIINMSDRYILSFYGDLSSVAIYVAAYGLMTQPFAIAQTTVEIAIKPYYYTKLAAKDEIGASKLFHLWVLAIISISLALMIGIIVFAPVITRFCLAQRYRYAWRLMPLLALGNVFLSVANTVEKVFYANRATSWCLSIRLISVVFCLTISLPMIKFFGLYGAAMASPIYYGLQLMVCVGFVATRAGIRTRV